MRLASAAYVFSSCIRAATVSISTLPVAAFGALMLFGVFGMSAGVVAGFMLRELRPIASDTWLNICGSRVGLSAFTVCACGLLSAALIESESKTLGWNQTGHGVTPGFVLHWGEPFQSCVGGNVIWLSLTYYEKENGVMGWSARRRRRRYRYRVAVVVALGDRNAEVRFEVSARHWRRALSCAHLVVQRAGYSVLAVARCP